VRSVRLPRSILAGLLVLAASTTLAKDGPRITAVRPVPELPYLVVDVTSPRDGAETAPSFTFEADGRPVPSRALGGGSTPEALLATYLVFPGPTCRSVVARWGPGAKERSAPAPARWKAPALAVLLDRLGDEEALFAPVDLEVQVFPPARVRFSQDGSPLEATPVEGAGPGERLRVAPRWRPGRNELHMVVEGPAGRSERTLRFALLEDGGFLPGASARLVYGEVGSRSGPFYRLAVEGDAVAVAGEEWAQVRSADADGWLLGRQVNVATLRARAVGEVTLRIERKGSFLDGGYEPVAAHRVRVGPAASEKGGLRHDPVEDDPRHAEAFARIDAEVDAALKDHPQRGGEGFCHVVWETKKRLLKERYGIDWRAPDELNPQVIFD
jgi:hypothetical protein